MINRTRLAVLVGAASVGALMAKAVAPRAQDGTTELVGTKGLSTIADKQKEAARVRAGQKVSRRAATNALVAISQEQLVLGHIHPRWLRHAVTIRLDAGEEVTFDMVEAMRAEGPEHG